MKLSSKKKLFLPIVVAVILALLKIASPYLEKVNQTSSTKPESGLIVKATRDDPATLGLPVNTTQNAANAITLKKTQFTVSYSCQRNIANWVGWHLSAAWLGNEKRHSHFFPEKKLPHPCQSIKHSHYFQSGFDRGHLCPSGDRTSSSQDNEATFVMSNIVPQAPNLNRICWEQLESFCRNLVKDHHKELYIIAGCYGEGGIGEEVKNGDIAKKSSPIKKIKKIITVPKNMYKIIVVLDIGENDLKRITPDTRIIAVNFPNSNNVSEDWRKYLTSVQDIEAKYGWQFFTKLSPQLQEYLKKKIDNGTLTGTPDNLASKH